MSDIGKDQGGDGRAVSKGLAAADVIAQDLSNRLLAHQREDAQRLNALALADGFEKHHMSEASPQAVADRAAVYLAFLKGGDLPT